MVDACGQTAGVDGVDNLAGSLEAGGVNGAAAVVDDGDGVVLSIAEVDLEVGLVSGGVGIELAEVVVEVLDIVDADGTRFVVVLGGPIAAEDEGDVLHRHGRGVEVEPCGVD